MVMRRFYQGEKIPLDAIPSMTWSKEKAIRLLLRWLPISGRKNVMSMRKLFCPDPLDWFEKMAGFQILFCLKIKCFHS